MAEQELHSSFYDTTTASSSPPDTTSQAHPGASQVQQENAGDETTDRHGTGNITEELHSSFYNATTASSSPLDPVLPDQPSAGEELQDNVASQEDSYQRLPLSGAQPNRVSEYQPRGWSSSDMVPIPLPSSQNRPSAPQSPREHVPPAPVFVESASAFPDNDPISYMVPEFITMEGLGSMEVDVLDEDTYIPDIWVHLPSIRAWAVPRAVRELNTRIHMWLKQAVPGEQLQSDAPIMRLFQLLQRLGRPAVIPEVMWDPDNLKGWPCIFLARKLYTWRQPIPAKPLTNPVTIVCISDTHNSQPSLPDGDILIHSGDLTQSGSLKELQAAFTWLNAQPHPTKIVVAGNHDLSLDPRRHEADHAIADLDRLDWGEIIYLNKQETTVACANGRQLRIYGSPLTKRNGNWAFQYPPDQDLWTGSVSEGIDVLITHGPPRAHLDLLHLGCNHLLRELWRVRPKLHVFGHVHAGAGTEWILFDALQEAYERTVVAKGGDLESSVHN
ncbi:hypothetical protein N7519_007188 [Penicillium mononematosum]|uniref:uncharacterized protein n=1 Tax=Penicillium mononematosum TaxID=268346 RepID=UPI002548FEBD|nr:uncharacterized protein N7519_007188 [Penicillium mononematosum]KAJ6185887.1 hypothetical protein N7519_007188 [Penicillium mononematosum]